MCTTKIQNQFLNLRKKKLKLIKMQYIKSILYYSADDDDDDHDSWLMMNVQINDSPFFSRFLPNKTIQWMNNPLKKLQINNKTFFFFFFFKFVFTKETLCVYTYTSWLQLQQENIDFLFFACLALFCQHKHNVLIDSNYLHVISLENWQR